ncbi:MAG: rRNA pseudouridine synthase [candidate division KSB1 bacterium]|nr:rRNA pseudouridine synthase [candidate division KSB1 bacterium]MDZ7341726.1 rRNA pseudouridine synthase [candidate division KSB1 bacterium]
MAIRLNKYLSRCGLAARRKCDLLIRSGRVAINNQVVTSLGQSVDEAHDVVTVDGHKVAPRSDMVYILLHKPAGYITTVSDERGRRTVMSLIPETYQVVPVGRLDKDTTGVLLMTNDGQLAYQLTHPKFEIDKIYRLELDTPITKAHVQQLQAGVLLEDGMTSPCEVQVSPRNRRRLTMAIHEGRKRQIRRMLASLGYHVLRLARVQFATLTVRGLAPGQWRLLTPAEINRLKRIGSKAYDT